LRCAAAERAVRPLAYPAALRLGVLLVRIPAVLAVLAGPILRLGDRPAGHASPTAIPSPLLGCLFASRARPRRRSGTWASRRTSWAGRRRGPSFRRWSGRAVVCTLTGERSRGRRVGTCMVDGRDIGGELIEAGLARNGPRYSYGRYAVLEPQAARRLPLPGYCILR
jgi:hypothetical protein